MYYSEYSKELCEKIITLGTIDSPLDSENQAEYRANRDVVEDNTAFVQMKEDAKQKRSFSNIVAEYITSFDEEHPLKIIGGQHRFIAISDAYEVGVDQFHGLKVYFGLNTEQRLDLQLISNTNIAVSTDLLDRMLETVKGPQLRIWCQQVGLLNESEDFADRKQRGGKLQGVRGCTHRGGSISERGRGRKRFCLPARGSVLDIAEFYKLAS